MTSFSFYKGSNQDVDLLVGKLAETFQDQGSLAKTASVTDVSTTANMISGLVSNLVKSASFLEGPEHNELLSQVDETLSFIDSDIIN